MKNFEENLENYIELFDIEKQLFKNGEIWKQKGYLEKSEFLQICLWKSRRPKKFYEQNSEKEIIKITNQTFQETSEIIKIELLTKLKGVSIPTASAILSVTDPKNYPIIDIRCVETLQDLNELDVFDKCLEINGIADTQKASLRSAYEQILHNIYHDDAQAE